MFTPIYALYLLLKEDINRWVRNDILITNPLGHQVTVDYQAKRIVLKIIYGNKKETVYEMKKDECRTD